MTKISNCQLDVDPEIRTTEIIIQGRVIQSQLEGIFRKMYQACTQEGYMGQLSVYRASLEKSMELHDDLEVLREELSSLQRQENESNTNLM